MTREMKLPPRTRVAAKYNLIAEDLRRRIGVGELTGMLPGVRQLAEEYEVTLMTANKAVNQLVDDGFLYRIPHTGTFVSDSAPVRTNAIAVIVNDINLPLTSRALRSMEMIAGEFETRLLFFQHRGDAARELGVAKELTEHRTVDSVVLMPSEPDNPQSPALAALEAGGLPVVVFPHGVMPEWQRFHTIRGDHGKGFEKGTRHLIAGGHRRIALVFSASIDAGELEMNHTENDRWQGYARAMEAAGLQAQAPIFFDPDHRRDASATNRLLAALRDNSAVFAYCDSTAASLLTVLHQAGVRVPNDISLLSYDGAPFTEELHLSTMSQPMEEMGRRAVEILKHSETDKPPVEVVFEAELVERGSVKHLEKIAVS